MIFKAGSKRIISISLILLAIVSLWMYVTFSKPEPVVATDGNIKAVVLYAGDGQAWMDTYSHLEQPLIANMEADAIDIENETVNLSLYDAVYLDESIMQSPKKDEIKEAIIQFTTEGGGLFIENQFWNFFSKDFIGAEEFVKLSAAPKSLEFPEVRHNLIGLQEIIKDFDYIYKDYIDYELLDTYDYGYGVQNSSGEVLAEENGIALYTVNNVGEGYVFFTNPLLPNKFNINGLSMKSRDELQQYFANTSASCNQILLNQFAAFISKENFGFSVERVFGNYGRPSMAWQLHYEEITGIQNNSAEIFTEVAKRNLQIPSYTIIRNSYTWFNRYEVVTYLLNEGVDDNLTFAMDEYENAYSSGRHMVSDGEWLSLGVVKDAGSYFVDYPEYDQRAYPFAIDYNKDGMVDIVAGSQDGYFYYFKGEKIENNYEASKAKKLTDSNGTNINVQGFSSPTMMDVNGDQIMDLISGSSEGNIYWFSGNGDLTFESQGILIETTIKGQSMPSIGDINQDGIEDLVVGSNEKSMEFYYGKYIDKNLAFSSSQDIELLGLENIDGNWLSPHIIDIDNDGINDIVVGTHQGYIAKFIGDGQSFTFDGYMEGTEKNYKGNNNLKFGNNSVPIFTDLNNDGKRDLIVGSLEYGLAYPIDSIYFPFKKELAEQIEFMQDNGHYVGFHFYTNIGASDEYEKNELKMHLAALDKYGIKNNGFRGFNQHTWHTSENSDTQSLDNGFDAGLMWASGFKPSKSNATPQVSAETAINIPFQYVKENFKGTIVFNTSTMLYDNKGWGDISAKYDLPVSMYYHCDFAYAKPEMTEADVLKAADFARRYNYNFVTEDQYVKAIAASYNTDFSVIIDSIKGKDKNIVITSKTIDRTIPLYDEDYQKAVGVKVVLGEKYLEQTLSTNSPIWHVKDQVIYMGVDGESTISKEKGNKFHLNRANLPVDIRYTDNGAQVKFLSGGMMQVEVTGNATTEDEDWIITKSENQDATIFTKFGEPETLNIKE